MEEQYIEGNKKRKVQFLTGIVFAVGIIVLLKSNWFLSFYAIQDGATLEQIKHQSMVNTTAVIIVTLFIIAIALYITKIIFAYANKAIVSRQYPPPNAKIPFKHKIYYGNSAIKSAKSLKLLCILNVVAFTIILLFSIYMEYLIQTMTDV